MVLPGPETQQLATYIGGLMHRTRGGIVAAGLFVLPSLFILIALAAGDCAATLFKRGVVEVIAAWAVIGLLLKLAGL